ncbi:MAG TPA: radical SAM protein [Phycisphaerales bacterium]|nr:radical SAM protein [Phycisphaerales bacterium]
MPTLAAPARPATADPRLDAIRDKVERGERLSLADGEVLFGTRDVWGVLAMAHSVRTRLHGTTAFYNINRHLNYSNVCALSCKFCEFYAKDGDARAYTRDMEYVREQARSAVEAGATEIHSVGGLHPALPFTYYTDLVSTIRSEARRLGSDLHVKAFTAVEVVHLCRIARVYKGASTPGEEGRRARREAIRWVLERLKEAGLGSLPGGGAEVFDDRVHDEAYRGKIRSDVWLDVHRVAHELGLNTNATLLYGHIENRADRLVHMDMLRRAQDEALARMGYEGTRAQRHEGTKGVPGGHLGYTGGEGGDAPAITLTRPGTPLPEHVAFGSRGARSSADGACGYYQTIIPLPFFPDGCELEHLPGPTGLENARTIAIARLMLDNFPHVKAFWIMQTLPMAQVMLGCGADDIDGTVVWYDITKVNHGAGQGAGSAGTHQEVSVRTLQTAIREAGFEPVERDTLYRRVVRDGRAWRVA